MTLKTLLDAIQRNGDISETDARAVVDLYSRERIVRHNVHDGYSVVHGAFLDRDVIRRALQ